MLSNDKQGDVADDLGVEHLAATLSVAREQAKELEKSVAELERRLRIARGTSDVQVEAGQAVAQAKKPKPEPKPDIRELARLALIRDPLSQQQLALTLHESPGKIAELMRSLRQEKLVSNIGSADSPRWIWRVGDQAEPAILRQVVRRLLSSGRSFTTRELAEATGARMGRVGGEVVAAQRDPAVNIVDLSPTSAGQWIILPPHARDARLQPKKKR